MGRPQKSHTSFLFHDAAVVCLSVVIALILVKTHVLASVLTSSQELEWLGSFIAGMFFTSIFTTAPATVALGEIAHANSIFATAFLGALGAVTGDMIIFRFMKDRVSDHLAELARQNIKGGMIRSILELKFFRWFTFLLAGLVIASPLPDELGVSLLGLSKMRTSSFMILSFISNFVGIILIGLVAKSL
jgi:uncharacterized membrane protein YdjX (TVP38/TMEM64 family)